MRYILPQEVAYVSVEDKELVIFSEGCNWLVLPQGGEKVYRALAEGKTIAEVLAKFKRETVISVIAEIEAKDFVHSSKDYVLQTSEVFIYLTNRCNLKCPYCYLSSGDVTYAELSLSQWQKVLENLFAAGFTTVTFSGGEPLLYPAFPELCEFAHKLGFQICVLSNGLLWTEELIARLAPVLSEVQLSLDGFDADSYAFVRKVNGFDRVLRSLDLLYDAGVMLSISVTPLYENVADFQQHYINFGHQLLSHYPNLQIKFSYELMPGRAIEVSTELNDRYRQIIYGIVEELYPDYAAENFYMNLKTKKRIRGCGYGGLTLAADGNVYWCNRLPQLKSVGNILSMPLEQILSMSMQTKSAVAVEHVRPCNDCPVKYICGGGCRLQYLPVSSATDENIHFETKCSETVRMSFYKRMICADRYFYV